MRLSPIVLCFFWMLSSCTQEYGVDLSKLSQGLAPAAASPSPSSQIPSSGSGNGTAENPLAIPSRIFQGATDAADRCQSITVDSSHNLYCGGTTSGNLGEARGGGEDAFIMKMTPAGVRLWVRQLGKVTFPSQTLFKSSGLHGVAVDSSKKAVYAVGATTQSLGEANAGSWDGVVVKLDSDTGQVIWVKQFGMISKISGVPNANQGWDILTSVTVDSIGNIIVGGRTNGNMGEANAFVPPGYPTTDLVLAKLEPQQGNLLWMKQMGAVSKVSNLANANAGDDECFSVAVDSNDSVYCGGATTGNLGEINAGSQDAFVAKFDISGNRAWIRQVGTGNRSSEDTQSFKGNDVCKAIALDQAGAVYCGGHSAGKFAETNSNPTNANSYDVILFKLNANASLAWKTQLGGVTKAVESASANHGLDFAAGIAVSSDGKTVFLAGQSNGIVGEANGSVPPDPNYSWHDAFVLKAETSSGRLIKTKQLGQASAQASNVRDAYKGNDSCLSAAIDSSGIFYCAGVTSGNMGEVSYGSMDYFIWKIGADF